MGKPSIELGVPRGFCMGSPLDISTVRNEMFVYYTLLCLRCELPTIHHSLILFPSVPNNIFSIGTECDFPYIKFERHSFWHRAARVWSMMMIEWVVIFSKTMMFECSYVPYG